MVQSANRTLRTPGGSTSRIRRLPEANESRHPGHRTHSIGNRLELASLGNGPRTSLGSIRLREVDLHIGSAMTSSALKPGASCSRRKRAPTRRSTQRSVTTRSTADAGQGQRAVPNKLGITVLFTVGHQDHDGRTARDEVHPPPIAPPTIEGIAQFAILPSWSTWNAPSATTST